MQLEGPPTRVLDEKVATDPDFGQKAVLDSNLGSHNYGFLSLIRFITQIDRPHLGVEGFRVGIRVLGRAFVFCSIVNERDS